MSRKQPTANDKAWEKLFETHKILEEVARKMVFLK
jgi:hypothetical protein